MRSVTALVRMGAAAAIAAALAGWRDDARRHGIAEREITMMADAIAPRLEAMTRAGR